ncbi:hypothetical protein NMK34_23835 [Micromonospora sp. BRA006-A]|uniref:hypothetical protein n=1 Tax=Micromonospora sp. BRA006-A TaxID=2962860 RepID=UPI00296FFCF6|nr:hypothetical protein [Micromonospora sp. BRA006-A]MDW3849649.1 hypothetical protein [Micromonospora sp. BRA006-A]MEE3918178.1 hypothetical protein [Micromonospora sp. BRA006-A]
MPDTSLGITYPASTDHTRIWEHFQTLAQDVDDLLSRKGFVAESIRNTASPNVTGTETVIQSVTFDAIVGVRYKAAAVQSFQSTGSGDSAVARLRWAAGISVTSGGAQIDSKIVPSYAANLGFVTPMGGFFVAAATGKITVGVTVVRNTGTNTWSSFGNASQLNTISVEGA